MAFKNIHENIHEKGRQTLNTNYFYDGQGDAFGNFSFYLIHYIL